MMRPLPSSTDWTSRSPSDRLGLETQVLQARRALHALDVAGVERGEIGAGAADVLDGAEQRRAPLQPLPVVGLAHQDVADDGAEEVALSTNSASVATRRGVHSRRAGGRPIGCCNTHD